MEVPGTTGRIHLEMHSAGPVVPREARRTAMLTNIGFLRLKLVFTDLQIHGIY